MTVAPLEYVAIRVNYEHSTAEILPILTAMQRVGNVQAVALLFVSRDAVGVLTTCEIHDRGNDDIGPYGEGSEGLPGLLTAEDIATLTADLPTTGSAVFVLLS